MGAGAAAHRPPLVPILGACEAGEPPLGMRGWTMGPPERFWKSLLGKWAQKRDCHSQDPGQPVTSIRVRHTRGTSSRGSTGPALPGGSRDGVGDRAVQATSEAPRSSCRPAAHRSAGSGDVPHAQGMGGSGNGLGPGIVMPASEQTGKQVKK